MIAELVKLAISDNLCGIAGENRSQENLFAISQLAEGADRFVAESALAKGFALQCIFPFPEDRYQQDFNEIGSVEEFEKLKSRALTVDVLPALENADMDGYQASGVYVLEHSDVLLAVWDGKPSNGPGGTTWAIDNGLRRGIPVIVIPTWAPDEACVAWRGTKIRLHSSEETMDRLRACISMTLNLQPSHRYWHECWPLWIPPFSYKFLRFVGSGGFDWKPLTVGRLEDDCPDVKLSFLKPHYEWLDALAVYFGEASRSATLGLQFFALVAVLLALVFGSIETIGIHSRILPKVVVFGEVLAILAMLAIDHFAHRKEWHELWLLYRSLAEQIRCMDYLLPLGMVLQSKPNYEPIAAGRSEHNRHTQFAVALQSALARHGGLPNVDRTDAAIRRHQERVRTYVTSQAEKYHRTVILRNDHAATLLLRFSHAAFWVAAAMCVTEILRAFDVTWTALASWSRLYHWLPIYDLVARWTSFRHWNWAFFLKVGSGLLAALGSAAAGLISRSELRRLAHRSSDMKFQLDGLKHDIERISADAESDGTQPSLQHLMEWVDRLSKALMSDVRDWQVLLSGKPPEKD